MVTSVGRISDVSALVTIINDEYVNSPAPHFKPLAILESTINDLIPGTPFPEVVAYSTLYEYIYLGNTVAYNSEIWGLQGAYYLVFGYGGSILMLFLSFVFAGALINGVLLPLIQEAPAAATYFISATYAFIENPLPQRWIPNNLFHYFLAITAFMFFVKTLSARRPVTRDSFSGADAIPA